MDTQNLNYQHVMDAINRIWNLGIVKMRKNKLTDRLSIKLKKCDITTPYTKAFYMLTVKGKPLGEPLTKQEGKILLRWFNSVVSEYNDQTELMDNY